MISLVQLSTTNLILLISVAAICGVIGGWVLLGLFGIFKKK